MPTQTTAGRLLRHLEKDSADLLSRVLSKASIDADRATAAIAGTVKLSLNEQHRLANATLVVAPAFTREASRLHGQVLAARSYESEDVERHTNQPPRK